MDLPKNETAGFGFSQYQTQNEGPEESFPMLRRSTIYIVDDEPEIIEPITYLVKPIGADIEIFSRAEDFLSKFHYDGPACLILDVRMPDMSGLELQEILAQEGCRIPIIFITGYADVRMAVSALHAGAVNFLEKPFRPQELFDQIQKILHTEKEAWQNRDEERSVALKLAELKPAEREVVALIKEGRTNGEIAQLLRLSIRGVEARRAKIKKILRVDSKAELMRLLKFYTSPKSRRYFS